MGMDSAEGRGNQRLRTVMKVDDMVAFSRRGEAEKAAVWVRNQSAANEGCAIAQGWSAQSWIGLWGYKQCRA